MNSPSVSYSTKRPLKKLFGTANIILAEVFFFLGVMKHFKSGRKFSESVGIDQVLINTTQGTISGCTKDFCWSGGWSSSRIFQRSFIRQNLRNHELRDFRKIDRKTILPHRDSGIRCCRYFMSPASFTTAWVESRLTKKDSLSEKSQKTSNLYRDSTEEVTGGGVFFLYVIKLCFYLFLF